MFWKTPHLVEKWLQWGRGVPRAVYPTSALQSASFVMTNTARATRGPLWHISGAGVTQRGALLQLLTFRVVRRVVEMDEEGAAWSHVPRATTRARGGSTWLLGVESLLRVPPSVQSAYRVGLVYS